MCSTTALPLNKLTESIIGSARRSGRLWRRSVLRASRRVRSIRQVFGRLINGTLSNVWVLLLCKAVIGAVSGFDTYLTIKYAVSLDVYEQNPIGRWLMGLDRGPICETQQIAAFITAKFIGTLLALIAIQGIAYWRVRVAGMVALPIALAQLCLVAVLIFGEG